MILKERDTTHQDHLNKQRQFGAKQEQEVAFYLKREFANNPDVLVFNDLRFSHQGEYSQIDHLVIHRLGFVLIESKSIYGQVRVNNDGEWSRSYQGNWQGLKSPLQQMELQELGLKRLLTDNADKMLIKILGLQTYFGGRQWDKLCAISSATMLQRESMPKAISNCVVKNEFLGKKLKELCDYSVLTGLIKTKPVFSKKEMKAISDFLLSIHEPLTQTDETGGDTPPENSDSAVSEPTPKYEASPQEQKVPTVEQTEPNQNHSPSEGIACKKCGERDNLTGAWGKYGYYVSCQSCTTNTSMKGPCPACNSQDNRIRKRGNLFTRHCNGCGAESTVFVERASA
ncbi:NERD domain-containing protein [Ferrimonas sp. SCSIO 43195]|uniref:NERD domain-containing protein n=1 Tax=Ferrimonas sp. SCSIO 43195 TaxID=2822844 RepID=UPI002075F792|nr:NERD domain-containing protein [Ferrimonas sp. SCSIO 43195]USD36552.1 NERD domain-containing protein [Ferrimonas sp. SCSIO 43195]